MDNYKAEAYKIRDAIEGGKKGQWEESGTTIPNRHSQQ